LTAPAVSVAEATEVSPELVDALARLLPQLSRSAPPLGEAEVADMIASPAVRLLVARDTGGVIVGSLSLVLFRIPSGVRAWIEDVIVDEAVRGRGVGEALTAEAIRLANAAGARTIDLTSRPAREAAHRLYTKLGFNVRETSVYRFDPG
jgi:ribosomal protein S18 acetylase RimI-like enzyme